MQRVALEQDKYPEARIRSACADQSQSSSRHRDDLHPRAPRHARLRARLHDAQLQADTPEIQTPKARSIDHSAALTLAACNATCSSTQ